MGNQGKAYSNKKKPLQIIGTQDSWQHHSWGEAVPTGTQMGSGSPRMFQHIHSGDGTFQWKVAQSWPRQWWVFSHDLA